MSQSQKGLRILMVSSLYPPHAVGGYEQACRDITDGLRARGHIVEVLTSTYGIDAPQHADGIHREIVYQRAEEWRPARPTAHSVAMSFPWHRQSIVALRRIMRTLRPQVVVVWSMIGLPMTILSYLQKTKLPLVFNVQDNWIWDHAHSDPWLLTWNASGYRKVWTQAKPLMRQFAGLIVPVAQPDISRGHAILVSAAIAQECHAHGVRFASERVIYNGIDLRHFRASRVDWSGQQPRRLLFLGRLDRAKGAHVAIRALSLILKQRGASAATLTVVGGGTDPIYEAELHDLVKRLGIEYAVTFVGPVPRSATERYYAEHDIFLFPSNWPEGFSLALMEAMATGIPVVGTTTGGSVELLRDDVTGLVVAPEDADSLAARVLELCDDPVRARRLAATGACRIAERHGLPAIVTQTEEYLRQTVGKQRHLAQHNQLKSGQSKEVVG